MAIRGLLIGLLLASSAMAQDQILMTEDEALAEVFGSGATIAEGQITLTKAQLREVQKRAGTPVDKSQPVRVVTKGGKVAGFAMVREEIGKYKPITFMVAVDAGGAILDILVLVYREPIGRDIEKNWWRRSFKGKSVKDPLRVNKDIMKLNGATMSCDAICVGARKVTAILNATLVKSKGAAMKIVRADKGPRPVTGSEVFMGSTCTIRAYGKDRGKVRAAIEKAFDEIDRLSGVVAVEESELSVFNAAAGKGDQKVSRDLAEFLRTCLDYAVRTQGSFDPTVAPALKLWGFYDHRYEVPGKAALDRTVGRIGYGKLAVNAKKRTASLARRRMGVDPGGIGRGYAVDRAVAILSKEGVEAALVDFGGRRFALGAPPGKRGWAVQVRDPFDPSTVAFDLEVKDGAVCTLDRFDEFFEEGGKAYSRVIHPETARPVEGVASVTVIAGSCTAADALSNALFVLGIEPSGAASFKVEASWIPADRKGKAETTNGFDGYIRKE